MIMIPIRRTAMSKIGGPKYVLMNITIHHSYNDKSQENEKKTKHGIFERLVKYLQLNFNGFTTSKDQTWFSVKCSPIGCKFKVVYLLMPLLFDSFGSTVPIVLFSFVVLVLVVLLVYCEAALIP